MMSGHDVRPVMMYIISADALLSLQPSQEGLLLLDFEVGLLSLVTWRRVHSDTVCTSFRGPRHPCVL